MSSERRFWPPPLAPRTALPVCVRVRVSSGYAECGKGLPYFSEESDPIDRPHRSGASVRVAVGLWCNLAPFLHFGRRDPSLHGYTYGYRHTGTHAMIASIMGVEKRGNMAETFKCCNVYNIYVLVVVRRTTAHTVQLSPPSYLTPHPQDLRAAQPASTTLAASCFFVRHRDRREPRCYRLRSYILLLPPRERSLVL